MTVANRQPPCEEEGRIVGIVDGVGRRFYIGDKVRVSRGEDVVVVTITELRNPLSTEDGKILGIDGADKHIWLPPDQVEKVV
ncbi:MAG: hypothetical protein HYT39_00380 [Candidatus Sungbacteria bacterium]|nr:hypothetical protein [Candidatus Sungbacteria bacterium]